MNAESEESRYTPTEWIEEYYPAIPAHQHVVHTTKPIDLVKVKHTQDIILGLFGVALILAAAAGTFLSLLGVQP